MCDIFSICSVVIFRHVCHVYKWLQHILVAPFPNLAQSVIYWTPPGQEFKIEQ